MCLSPSGGAGALLSSHSWVGGIGMVKSLSKVSWAILGNRDLKPEPTYWTRFCLWILAPAFASVLCKMFCEELNVQLGCTTWPELLQIPLGRIPDGCSWRRNEHGGGFAVRTVGNLPHSKFWLHCLKVTVKIGALTQLFFSIDLGWVFCVSGKGNSGKATRDQFDGML